MKPLICLLSSLLAFVLTASAAAPAPAPATSSHVWTDDKGNTFAGELMSANKAEVIIKSPSGSIIHLPRATLSAKDQAYADKAQSAEPIEVKLDVSRVKFSAADDNSNKGYTITTENWGYDITLTSKASHPATNLRVEYQLYVRQAQMGESMSSQPLKNRAGAKTISTLEANGKTGFKTTSVAARQLHLLPGFYWKATGRSEDVDDRLEGIWVRVYQGKTQIAEFVSSETFKKAGWPTTTPAK